MIIAIELKNNAAKTPEMANVGRLHHALSD